MRWLKDYQSWIPIFVLTLVMGYFLGLTIATVVDYRLKDAVINLPKPNNKVVIRWPSEEDKETFVSGSKALKKRSSKKAIKESFVGSQEEVTNETRPLFHVVPPTQEPDQIQDPMVKSYELAYELNQKLAEQGVKSFPYVAANFESSEGQYTNVSDPANFQPIRRGQFVEPESSKVIRPAANKIDVSRYQAQKTTAPSLPPRQQWCPTYKQQRPWENIWNHPNVVVAPKQKPNMF